MRCAILCKCFAEEQCHKVPHCIIECGNIFCKVGSAIYALIFRTYI